MLARSPLHKDEKSLERIQTRLRLIVDTPALARSFFKHPSVSYANDL
jgi:hypothetical protein